MVRATLQPSMTTPSPSPTPPVLPLAGADIDRRAALLERWTLLTGTVLPAMAARHDWPIRLDHCFKRVCLDAALGARWDTLVRRPAYRHLDLSQLAAAVSQAEAIVALPSLLPHLNRASLRLRGKA